MEWVVWNFAITVKKKTHSEHEHAGGGGGAKKPKLAANALKSGGDKTRQVSRGQQLRAVDYIHVISKMFKSVMDIISFQNLSWAFYIVSTISTYIVIIDDRFLTGSAPTTKMGASSYPVPT